LCFVIGSFLAAGRSRPHREDAILILRFTNNNASKGERTALAVKLHGLWGIG